MNKKFESDCGALTLLHIGLNTFYKGKHIPDIERLNRTIKERIRATYKNINRHLTKILGMLIREMVYAEFFSINSFPDSDGISDNISN